MTPDTTPLHELWGLAHGTPGYNEQKWLQLQVKLVTALAAATRRPPDKVYIVCHSEVFVDEECALGMVRRCIEDGMRAHLDPTSIAARTLRRLLDAAAVDLALAYWNDHCPNTGGTGAPIDFREAVVRTGKGYEAR